MYFELLQQDKKLIVNTLALNFYIILQYQLVTLTLA
ncbi:hypothetical protein SRH_03520 [Mesomycoplasma hyorhinis MCLD]|uniref:Uncharacterized protein n=1 Tax=Mesomycoplasma hyorhinis (strain MCLD) TaxID=936139 RepID=A0ABM5M6K0_MESHM|nr:hypothetical protein SRH_03520 [Mesomycoplasma hyorhinis MCLD]